MRLTINEDTYIRAVAALQRSADTADHEAAEMMREALKRYNESITDKKREATQKATQKRSEKAKKKIEKAVDYLHKKGEIVNVTNVSRRAKVAYNTAAKYKHLFDATS